MDETETEPDETRAAEPRFKPWWFFGVLLTPAIITLLVTPFILRSDDSGFLPWGSALLAIASIIAGIYCGLHFVRAQGSLSQRLKIPVGVISIIGCICVSYGLAYGGCLAVGILVYVSFAS